MIEPEIIEKIEHGIKVCKATNTTLVHINCSDAEKILELLKEQESNFNWQIYYCPKCDIEHYAKRGEELTHCNWCGGPLKMTGRL